MPGESLPELVEGNLLFFTITAACPEEKIETSKIKVGN